MFCEVIGRGRDGFGDVGRAGAEYLVDDVTSPIKGKREICQQQSAATADKPVRRHTLGHGSALPRRWEVGYRHASDTLLPRLHAEQGTHLPGTSVTVPWRYSPDKLTHLLTRFKSETPQYGRTGAERLSRDVAVHGVMFSVQARRSAARERPARGIDGAQGVPNHLSQCDATADNAGLGQTRPLPTTFFDRI